MPTLTHKIKGTYRPKTEKATAPHSSTPAWQIPWAEEPGRLQSMGSIVVEHNWATSLWLFTFVHWRRKWQPTLVLLPGESQGRRSLVGCRLWGHTVGHNWSDLVTGAAQAKDYTEATWKPPYPVLRLCFLTHFTTSMSESGSPKQGKEKVH